MFDPTCVCARGGRSPRRGLPLLAVCLVLSSSALARAQGGAAIGGEVTDDTQSALPGVTVTLTNANTGATQAIVTGPEGNYRAVNLPPGPYTLVAELAGFAEYRRSLTLLVGANTTINITMTVATLNESIVVTGESPLVEVSKAQPSSVIVGEQLAALPVLDRNFLVLAQLLPGAAPLTGVNNRFAVTKFGGLADQRNGYTTIIDGGAVDDATWGSPVINMPQDAVQEFKVFRNQFDAQYGSALNAVVNVVSKSGANAYTGTGYYFGRDKSLNARNAKAATVPPFQQYRLGGTVGGPVVLNRTHFFGAYEFLGIEKAAIVSLPPNNPFATQQNGNYPFTQDEHMSNARVDHRFSDAQTLFVRYAFDRQYTPSGGPTNAASTIVDTSTSHSLVGDFNWVLSQRMVNTVRFHYLDHNLFTEPANFDLQVSRPSYTFGQNGVAPQYFPRKIASFFDTFYFNTARHDIKVGGEFTWASSNFEAHFNEHGAYSFTTDVDFNGQVPRTWPITFVQQTPGFYNYTSNQIALFVQDDVRIGDRFRLNLGLRYDLDTNLRQNDFYRDLLANPQYAGIERFVSADRGNDTNNFQPRIGATYDLRGNGTLVARAAAGMYVTRNRPWFQETSMDKTLGFAVRITDPLQLRNYPDINAVLGGKTLEEYAAAGGVRSLYLIADDYVLPYSINATAGIGWQLNGVTSLDVDYVHNVGEHQLGTTDPNLPASGAVTPLNPRPEPRFSQVGVLTNFSTSWYDALEVQLRTRVRGTDSLQVSVRLFEEQPGRRDLLQHVPRHRAHAARAGDESDRHAPQPQRRRLDVAAVGIPAERRLPRHQRRSARGQRRHRPRRRPQHAERSPRGPAADGRPRRRGRPAGDDQRVSRHPQSAVRRRVAARPRSDHHVRRATDQAVHARRHETAGSVPRGVQRLQLRHPDRGHGQHERAGVPAADRCA